MKTRLCFSILLIAVLLVPTTLVYAAAPASVDHFRMASGAGWADSGFYVETGQEVTVTAYGQVITAPINVFGHGSVSGPDGQEWNLGCGQYNGAPPPCALNDASYGALVGKIGADGTPFLIGANATFTTVSSGDLYLAVNDNLGFYSDNFGNYMVFFNE